MSDFQIIQKLGQGSYGTAYKARDNLSGEVIVMKQIPINTCDPGDLVDKLREC